MALIKRFKRVYHPSRRVKANDIYSGTLKHEPGTYYTDSEHEGGTWDSEVSCGKLKGPSTYPSRPSLYFMIVPELFE